VNAYELNIHQVINYLTTASQEMLGKTMSMQRELMERLDTEEIKADLIKE
jgi:hypothetical protein